MNPGTAAAAAGLALALGGCATPTPTPATDDAAIVGALDIRYQAAVERNDADAMAAILHDDFVLVTGRGTRFTRHDLLEEARMGAQVYERQAATSRTVHVYGSTAVVTALLEVKGRSGSKPIDYRLWYSDTYVRTTAGWRYAFGQASLPLPAAP